MESAGGLGAMGWVLGEEGHPDEGITHILRAQAMLQTIGTGLGYLMQLSLLAETYRKAGSVSEGLAVVDEALALIGAIGSFMDESEICRLKGELLLMKSEAELEAEDCFHHAIEVARQQQARSWELRATMSLCRLWQKQGKQESARQALAETYDWFTEGFDTPDLREAKATLGDLV